MIKESIRKTENLHIVMWLLKDTCWVLTWKEAGMIMVLPTLTVAIYITWRMRNHTAELFHNLAVCCWISANSIWMTGEFFFHDGLRNYAIVFFVLGLISVAYYYSVHKPREKRKDKLSQAM